MADIKIVGGKGPVDEGRGHKHHKDHERHEHECPVCLVNPGKAGDTFWPPFPANAVVTRTIYARANGSDHHGKGTAEHPYRTFQRAILDVPPTPPPGYSYIVDVTGIGVEIFPPQYCLPQITFPTLVYENDSSIPFFYSGAGLRVRALPQLASTVSPADATISATDAATVAGDPDTNLVALTISAPRTSWTAANLVGKQVIRTVGSTTPTPWSANSVIYGVVGGNQLLLTSDPTSFNGGSGSLTLAPGEEIQIVEPSATFQADPLNFPIDIVNDPFAGIVSTVNSIAFQGINFTQPNPATSALGILNCPQAPLELCNVAGLSGQGQAGTYWLYCNGCNITSFLASVNCSTFMAGCLLTGPSFYMVNATPQSFFDCVLSGCGSYSSVQQNGLFIESNTAFANCLIENSVPSFSNAAGDAIFQASGSIQLDHVQINGAAGDGVHVVGSLAQAGLIHVTGSGQGDFGVQAENGAQVSVDATTTVTGASGDTQSGSLAPTTYAQVAAGNAYDLPPNAASINVATGTRIFQS